MMPKILILLLISIIFLAAAFLFFAVKVIFKKNGEFRKYCASSLSKDGKPIPCQCDGQTEHCHHV
ncbi:MAG: hypothetical protein N2Z72_03375 [Bacteroidales bacterium]|nr:hypothetical protein [Bacteroidales bacterium]